MILDNMLYVQRIHLLGDLFFLVLPAGLKGAGAIRHDSSQSVSEYACRFDLRACIQPVSKIAACLDLI